MSKSTRNRSALTTMAVAALAALLLLALAFGMTGAAAAQPVGAQEGLGIAPSDVVTGTILHLNDFHGRLEPESSKAYTTTYKMGGGAAYVATVINQIRAERGAQNTLLLDAGDEYFAGQPVSQLLNGESTIDILNMLGYQAAEYGNHEFDRGQATMATRTAQANYPWLGANIVVSGTAWTSPSWAKPWITMTVGSGSSSAVVGVIGLDTTETPEIVIADAVAGLVFKDPTETVLHYYDEVRANSDAVVVLAHIGTSDTGKYKGLKTVAAELVNAGKPIDLMIGGHAHEPLTSPVVISGTTIVEAGYYGYWVGRTDISIDRASKKLSVTGFQLVPTMNEGLTPDAAVAARVAYWKAQVAPRLAAPVGSTNVSLMRNYNGESNLGSLVADSMRWKADQLDDAVANNSVDLAFTNSGGLRADLPVPVTATLPYQLTWGDTFTVLPFGNTLYLMSLTGAQVQQLMDQSASLYKGVLQASGIAWYYYNDKGNATPTAWGAYGISINGQALKRDKVYRIVTNNFLATGGDGFTTFKAGKNRVDMTSADMQEGLNDYLAVNSPLDASKIAAGRLNKLDKIVTVLHTNDTHGYWDKATYQGQPEGMVYLASLVKAERAHNPTALLVDIGDNFQGNSFAFFYRNLDPNPISGGLNLLKYDAFVPGNHEFNFGAQSFKTMLGQLKMPIVAANMADDGRYSGDFISTTVKSYTTATVQGLKISMFGLTNPRVPFYELPSNIAGLSFTPATVTAGSLVPAIRNDVKPDLLLGLTHIGYSQYGSEPDNDVSLAKEVPGIDAIIGGHSHTKIDPSVIVTSTMNPNGTLIAQSQSNAMYLGKVNIGFTGNITEGYKIALREGFLIPANEVAPAINAELNAYLKPFLDEIAAYNATQIGQTQVPIDALQAFTQETNGANVQADAAIYELGQHGIAPDFHLSGAMTNKKVAATATPGNPYMLTVNDMFSLMPYENSLVVLRMNGPQLKAVLERGYRNYFYYKYYGSATPPWNGLSHYTTCMLDISKGGQITYADNYTRLPDGNNVVSLTINGTPVDFNDAAKYYKVSTVNYLAAGSCNFTVNGVSLWPIDQMENDTQYYVRDSVIDYVKAQSGPIAPAIEGRLQFVGPGRDADMAYTTNVSTVDPGGRVKYIFTLQKNWGQPLDLFACVPLDTSRVGYVAYSGQAGVVPLPMPCEQMAAALKQGPLALAQAARSFGGDPVALGWSAQVTTSSTAAFNYGVDVRAVSGVLKQDVLLYENGEYWTTVAANDVVVAPPLAFNTPVTGTFTSVADAFLGAGYPNDKYGSWAFLYAGSNDLLRSVIRFNLGSIDPVFPVDKATLMVYADSYSGGGSPADLAAYQVTTPWDESTVTWNTPWTTPGGDFDPALVGKVSIFKSDVPGWKSIDVTPLVATWVAMPGTNDGSMVRLVNITSFTTYRLDSRNHWYNQYSPKLVVNYRKP